MMIDFKINGTPIMSWAKKHCRDEGGYLLHAVITFNELLINQLIIEESCKIGTIVLEEDGACINMICPYTQIFRELGHLTSPLVQVIKQGKEQKIKLLLDHGAIVTQEMLNDTRENKTIHTLLQSAYDKQCCCKCKQQVERMCIQLDHDYQVCMVCHSCKKKNGLFL